MMKLKYIFLFGIFLLLISFFLFKKVNEQALSIKVQAISGCSGEQQKTYTLLTISKNHERYEMVGENEQVREIILSDFQKQESWILYPQKKQALLLLASTQNQTSSLQNLKLLQKNEVSCLGERTCLAFSLTTANNENLEVQVLMSQFDGVELWKFAQQRDVATWGFLQEFLDKYAPSRPIVSLKMKSQFGCKSLTVTDARLVTNIEETFKIPLGYTKNSYSELQKLPPEVRESILKKEKVQILEATPEKTR